MLNILRRFLQTPLYQTNFTRCLSSTCGSFHRIELLQIVNYCPQHLQQQQQQLQHGFQSELIAPQFMPYGIVDMVDPWVNESLEFMNRNNRKSKRANHGKRPCSRVGRRAKAARYGNPKRG